MSAGAVVLPADSHVHSEWSWDAPLGEMERTCERAVAIGLPAVAFTEHVDHTRWLIRPDDLAGSSHLQTFATADGTIAPPPFDAEGYLACVQVCRDRFPGLRVMAGVELGEPHRHPADVERVLGCGDFERVLGSLHSLPVGERFAEPPYLFGEREAADVVRDYLAEVTRLVDGSEAFTVLAHIDYPLRYWPADRLGPFEIGPYEEDFRAALRALAGSGRALELNTRSVLRPQVVRWWREDGGRALTFGSDAHEPDRLAEGFREATAMAEAAGFHAGRHPWDVWSR